MCTRPPAPPPAAVRVPQHKSVAHCDVPPVAPARAPHPCCAGASSTLHPLPTDMRRLGSLLPSARRPSPPRLARLPGVGSHFPELPGNFQAEGPPPPANRARLRRELWVSSWDLSCPRGRSFHESACPGSWIILHASIDLYRIESYNTVHVVASCSRRRRAIGHQHPDAQAMDLSTADSLHQDSRRTPPHPARGSVPPPFRTAPEERPPPHTRLRQANRGPSGLPSERQEPSGGPRGRSRAGRLARNDHAGCGRPNRSPPLSHAMPAVTWGFAWGKWPQR